MISGTVRYLGKFYVILFAAQFYHVAINVVVGHSDTEPSNSKPHSQVVCDDGKTGIDIDLNETETSCMSERWKVEDIQHLSPSYKCYKKSEQLRLGHVCINKKIDNLYGDDEIPNSGPHRENWAVYGEYGYLPPGRFVHNLEHGAVVFLYHPCTPIELVDELREVALTCTWKHTLSCYPKVLNEQYPLAVVTYGCVYKMSHVNATRIRTWVRKHLKSPEARVFGQGTYDHGLLHKSDVPDDPNNIPVCPDLPDVTLQSRHLDTATNETGSFTGQPEQSNNNGEQTQSQRTEEAAWAIGSLAFLLIGLVVAVCYTQLWKKGNHGESFEKARVWNDANAPGSISVAAIVRRFPHVLMDKVKRARVAKSSRQYQLVEDDRSSDDEV